ncbi:glycine receptor subunit alpha-4-like [Oppia nitens]|uniref:glycine receptor subunit alpha-4-like n=1 Tax=Oppia nitens TaxID=1686743 RepID=UPI0023DCB39C|nr:glycine receptor subunit alpha-4-like [Oppia nitens]
MSNHRCQKSWQQLLPSNYNKDIAPVNNGQPVDVYVSMVVLSYKPEPGAEQAVRIDFFYQLEWYDHRLRAPDDEKVTLGAQWKDKLWVPDTYFRNSMSGGIPIGLSPTVYFVVTNSTRMFMAARYQLVLACDMDFRKFPFDRQSCPINITTLSNTIETVQLYWSGFRIGSHVVLPEFEIEDYEVVECIKRITGLGIFSCLKVIVYIERNIGKYLVKRYIPSTLIVIMTFIGFWLPQSAVPGRVALSITGLLALVAQQIQGEINISYIYALEVWTIICIVFVFLTLIEFALAVGWPQQYSEEQHHQQNNLVFGNNRLTKRLANFVAPDLRNNRVDKVSRFLFPIAFGLTIIVYSLTYYNL